ncbi:GGDEF domain-containing protein [Patescibacteria group bacterium]|nr:GGDEF domain-containing protein [Patescibacteria group bacterium]MCL5409392.1 GGDEF domain-containing protein [Patescibacteria group bacterium]
MDNITEAPQSPQTPEDKYGIIEQREMQRLEKLFEAIRSGAITRDNQASIIAAEVQRRVSYERRIDASLEDPMMKGFYTKEHFKNHVQRVIDDINEQHTVGRAKDVPYKGAVLVIVDVDHLKEVNDQHGHLTGDEVLLGVANQIKAIIKRRSDVFGRQNSSTDEETEGIRGRFGGDEIVLLLDDTDTMGAARVLGKLAHNLRTQPIKLANGQEITQTASIGATAITPGQTFDEIFEKADQATYFSKTHGRDQVTIWTEEIGKQYEAIQPAHS